MPLEKPRELIPVLQTEFEETDPHFSPNNRWIAYTSNESGRYEVYVRASPKVVSGVEPKIQGAKQVSTSGGAGPRWRRDGRELYYVTPDHMLMAADVKPGEGIEISTPRPLFKTCESIFWTASWQSTYDPAADGQRFLFNCRVETSSKTEVVIHWTSKIQNGAAPR